jgi:hypothetical protein
MNLLWQMELRKKDQSITGKVGLSFLAETMMHFGMQQIVETTMQKSTNRSIKAWEKVVAGVLVQIAGGNCVEDLEILRSDKGFLRSIGRKTLPCPDTYLNFLEKKRTAAQIRKVLQKIVIKALIKSKLNAFTYDNDATYFNSEKNSAAYSYQKEKQFSALLGVIPELAGLCVTMDYRPGNVSPAKGILNQLRKMVMMANKASKKVARFRSDSAAHNLDIFLYCEAQSIRFFVSLDKNAVTLKEAKGIPCSKWASVPDRKDVEWAESTHAIFKGKKKGLAMRTLILRWKDPNPDLFSNGYCYHIIATNDWEIAPMDWLSVHNGRMASENVNKELKHGYSACYTPSHSFSKNRAYFMMATLAYNVVQLSKLFYLGATAIKWSIKKLRYRFIYSIGSITKHARKSFCNLINVHDDTFKLFKNIQTAWLRSP